MYLVRNELGLKRHLRKNNMALEFFWCGLASPSFTVAGITIDPHRDNFIRHPLITDTKRLEQVIGPIYGKPTTVRMYKFHRESLAIEIGITEISNCVFVAYAAPEDMAFCSPQFKWIENKWVRQDPGSSRT
jgi:hypothetical protein